MGVIEPSLHTGGAVFVNGSLNGSLTMKLPMSAQPITAQDTTESQSTQVFGDKKGVTFEAWFCPMKPKVKLLLKSVEPMDSENDIVQDIEKQSNKTYNKNKYSLFKFTKYFQLPLNSMKNDEVKWNIEIYALNEKVPDGSCGGGGDVDNNDDMSLHVEISCQNKNISPIISVFKSASMQKYVSAVSSFFFYFFF